MTPATLTFAILCGILTGCISQPVPNDEPYTDADADFEADAIEYVRKQRREGKRSILFLFKKP